MLLEINTTYEINTTQKLTLYKHGCGFVHKHGRIDFDFSYTLDDDGLHIVLNDDASWVDFVYKEDSLEGTLFSYLREPTLLQWSLTKCEKIEKPKALNALQSVRFHDKKALESFHEKANYSELLIEAATCGHEEMLELCLAHKAHLHVDIETFLAKDTESCFALTKAIQYGHLGIVKRLLKEKVHIHPASFDLSRDNFYHACFLYQSRPDIGEQMIELILSYGVNFSTMSAYYLCAVMFTFENGPLGNARAKTQMLERLLDAGADINAMMLILAHDKDTPFMFAAHMGLFPVLKVLHKRGADVFLSHEGFNALNRAQSPKLIDPQMPSQTNEKVVNYLMELGLQTSTDTHIETVDTQEKEATNEKIDLTHIQSLFEPR